MVKSDALKALRNFIDLRKKGPTTLLSKFVSDLTSYAECTYAPSRVELYERTFRYFIQRASDLPLHIISARQIAKA